MPSTPFFQNGMRFGTQTPQPPPDWMTDPVMIQEWKRTHGDVEAGPQDVQVAQDDRLHTGSLIAMLALTAAGGALGEYFSTAGAASGAGGGAASAGAGGLAAPGITTAAGSVLPASTLPAMNAAAGAGFFGGAAGGAGAAAAGGSAVSHALRYLGAVGDTVGQIYSAKTAANAARDAAATQTQYANRALDLQREQWQAQQARQQPYVDAGTGALGRLQGLATAPRPPMPMFNGQQPGGGWTPMNYAQQPQGPQMDPNMYAKLMALAQQGNR